MQASLFDLGIDDAQMPLTEEELTATIANLLRARSGIYIEAAGETAEMKASRPQRGQYLPGERCYYNNWDVNTLRAILAQTTDRSLHAYMDELSTRLGFLDYQPGHLFYADASGSEHDQ